MADLKKLYSARDILIECKAKIPIELQNQIEEAERELIQQKISDLFLETLPATIAIDEITSPLTIAVTYVNGNLHYLGYSLQENIIEKFSIIEDFSEGEEDTDDRIEEEEKKSSKSHGASIPFKVRFTKEGKEFFHKQGVHTMIQSLQFMGLEKISKLPKLKCITFKDFPLVGKEKRITPNNPHMWQREVDGWWIYVNMPHFRKIQCITKVAELLDYDIEISEP